MMKSEGPIRIPTHVRDRAWRHYLDGLSPTARELIQGGIEGVKANPHWNAYLQGFFHGRLLTNDYSKGGPSVRKALETEIRKRFLDWLPAEDRDHADEIFNPKATHCTGHLAALRNLFDEFIDGFGAGHDDVKERSNTMKTQVATNGTSNRNRPPYVSKEKAEYIRKLSNKYPKLPEHMAKLSEMERSGEVVLGGRYPEQYKQVCLDMYFDGMTTTQITEITAGRLGPDDTGRGSGLISGWKTREMHRRGQGEDSTKGRHKKDANDGRRIRLGREDKIEVCRRSMSGHSRSSIARAFGVSLQTVTRHSNDPEIRRLAKIQQQDEVEEKLRAKIRAEEMEKREQAEPEPEPIIESVVRPEPQAEPVAPTFVPGPGPLYQPPQVSSPNPMLELRISQLESKITQLSNTLDSVIRALGQLQS